MFIGKNFQSLPSISYNLFWRKKINKKKKVRRGGESCNSEKSIGLPVLLILNILNESLILAPHNENTGWLTGPPTPLYSH